jgi:hypothetical protein
MDKLPTEVWLNRCARRIVQVDQRIEPDEAQGIARDLLSFERTAVMPPEQAVDFVASELSRGQRTHFERRAKPRH